MVGGGWGSPGGQKFTFFKHGHVAYQIDRDDKQNKMQVKFSPSGQSDKLMTLGWGQISKNFLPTLCAFSQVQNIKHIKRNFILWPVSCTRGGTWGC